MPTQAGVAPAERERGEAGKRKTDCDNQQDTERWDTWHVYARVKWQGETVIAKMLTQAK